MKREEAIDILEYHKEECEEDYWVARAEALEMAIKALKQESIIDKIRAEIAERVLESLSDGGDDWFAAEKVNECLEIIDECKAESEDTV